MLRSLKELNNYMLDAKDGKIGRCKDFLFDDEHWIIRYMVADTGRFLPGRKVLISPISIGQPEWVKQVFPVRLTKEQIKEAPGLDQDAPVSRQYEIDMTQYFGWSYYWHGTYPWGVAAYPSVLYDQPLVEKGAVETDTGDNHLRSVNEVRGYHIQATDNDIGHVEDFIMDDDSWAIRYMVVDTINWLPGRRVLVSPMWITAITWADRKVAVDLNREQVKDCPEYNPAIPLNRAYEEQIYDFYGRPKYWL